MNDNKILITFVMGTRPEIIKLAPLIALFKKKYNIFSASSIDWATLGDG